jgi:hypothetical protein
MKNNSPQTQPLRRTDAERAVDQLSEASPLRVLVAGGGVAGLETLMALRGLAGDLVTLTLIAPEDEFVYAPLTAQRPFSVGRIRSVGLPRAAQDAGAAFVAARERRPVEQGRPPHELDRTEREDPRS